MAVKGPADIWTTLIASRGRAILARRLVDNRPHPDSSPRSGEAPEHNRCGWSGPLAYNVLCCTQKRREQRRLHRVSTQPRRSCCYARASHRHRSTANWSPDPGWVTQAHGCAWAWPHAREIHFRNPADQYPATFREPAWRPCRIVCGAIATGAGSRIRLHYYPWHPTTTGTRPVALTGKGYAADPARWVRQSTRPLQLVRLITGLGEHVSPGTSLVVTSAIPSPAFAPLAGVKQLSSVSTSSPITQSTS